MKKSNSKRGKNGPSKKGKTADKSRSKKRIEGSLRNSKQRDRKGEEKSKSISSNKKPLSKNKGRIKANRVEKDDELELLNSLFLKELQKNDKAKKKTAKNKQQYSTTKQENLFKNLKKSTKNVLSFERKPNKENKRLRGNVFVIIFPPKSTFQQKINLINNWDGKELKYYVDRFSKLPQAIQVIITTKKGNETFSRASRISPFDFVVNVPNTKKFILEMLVSFQDNYLEYIDGTESRDSDWVYNPGKIISVTVRFIY